MSDDRRISKRLSYWLRHRPDAAGLVLDLGGWAPVGEVLVSLRREGLPGEIATLHYVVSESDKNRFELSPDGRRIRARQGHSVAVDLDWPVQTPPEFLFHGTVARFLEQIFREGLRPMKRHHVHLSPDTATATVVGARRGEAVTLRVAAAQMAAQDHVFRLSGNGVWLVDHVPAVFLEVLGD